MRVSCKTLALSAALSPLSGWTQHVAAEPQTDPVVLPAVIIYGSRLDEPGDPTDSSLGATTRNTDALRARRATTADAASLLQGVPGVSLSGAGGVSSLPAIRGLGDERLRIQVDAMDLMAACGNHMNPVLSYIDAAQVAKIHVYSGVTPVSVGGDNIGGTIQVESAPPRFVNADQPPQLSGSLGASYRSNGRVRGANASATWAGERLNLHYEGATSDANNYRAASAFKAAEPGTEGGRVLGGDEVGSTAYRTQNHKLGAAWQQDGHLIQADLGWQDIAFQGFPNQRMDMTANRSTQLNLRYSGRYDWGDLKVHGWRQHVEHQMDMGPDRYSYGSGMPMRTSALTAGGLAQANWLLSQTDTLRLGAEFQRYTLYDWWPPAGASGSMAPNNFWNIDHGQRNKVSSFAEWEARFHPQWVSLLGARVTRVTTDTGAVQGYNSLPTWADDAAAFNAQDRKRSDSNLDLTALVSYTPDASQNYEAGLARKARAPSLYQRYPWSTNTMAAGMNNFLGDGNGYIGNLNLKPEVASTLSLTGDWHAAHSVPVWGLRATAHLSRIDNYIDAVRCPDSLCRSGDQNARDQFVILQYANHDAQMYGIDVSGHWTLADSADWGRVQLTGSANWLRGSNRTTGDNLYHIVPLDTRLSLEQRIALADGTWTTTLEWQGVRRKQRVSAVRNEIPTAGYGLVHLRASYEAGGLRLDAGVENLLNTSYALPLGGAYIGQGSTMMLNTAPWGVAVPGPGRSLYASVNFTF